MSFYKAWMAGIEPLMAGIVFEGEGGGGDGDFGEDGFNSEGFNAEGFNADGYNSDGFNPDGYNSDGLDSDGKAKGSGGDTSWRDGITEKDHLAIAGRFNSPADVIKAVSDLRKQVSTSIRVPGEDAKPEDILKFNKALGVPDDPKDYKFDMPEGREPTDADKAFHGKMAGIFHKSGVSASAATNLIAGYNELAAEAEEAMVAADKKFVEESTAALQKKWGTDMERNTNLSTRAAKYLLGDNFEAAQQIEMKDGRFMLDHPVFVEMLAKAGAEMDEDGFQKMDPEGAESLKDEHAELSKQILAAHDVGDSKLVETLSKKRTEISQKLHGTSPAVGQEGRNA